MGAFNVFVFLFCLFFALYTYIYIYIYRRIQQVDIMTSALVLHCKNSVLMLTINHRINYGKKWKIQLPTGYFNLPFVFIYIVSIEFLSQNYFRKIKFQSDQ